MTQNTNKIALYNQEIQPMLKVLNGFKEDLKDFKETDEKALKLIQAIKDAQEELKAYLEDNPTSKDILENIKEHTKEFDLAVKAAAKGSAYKPAELKQYYVARNKDKVEDVIGKGDLFSDLNKELA